MCCWSWSWRHHGFVLCRVCENHRQHPPHFFTWWFHKLLLETAGNNGNTTAMINHKLDWLSPFPLSMMRQSTVRLYLWWNIPVSCTAEGCCQFRHRWKVGWRFDGNTLGSIQPISVAYLGWSEISQSLTDMPPASKSKEQCSFLPDFETLLYITVYSLLSGEITHFRTHLVQLYSNVNSLSLRWEKKQGKCLFFIISNDKRNQCFSTDDGDVTEQ